MFALVEVTRGDVVERVEYGHCAMCDVDGNVLWSAGDAHHLTYMRSSAKPFQATALVQSGALERFNLGDTHLALACGSHHGEPGHVQTALEILNGADVSPTALQCGTHDLGEPEGSRLARAGMTPTPLHNNCSGKHSGMLASARARGLPIETYLDLDHPHQQAILRNMAECAHMPVTSIHLGTDGCSAPNFAMPVSRMARAFAQLAAPRTVEGSLARALARVSEAMYAHPWLVSGTTGFDTALMRHAKTRVVSKAGAEGLQCLAIPSLGLGLAVKISSGRPDRLPAVVITILRSLGILDTSLHPDLAVFDAPAQRNHRGTVVGATRVLLDTGPLADLAGRLGRTSPQ